MKKIKPGPGVQKRKMNPTQFPKEEKEKCLIQRNQGRKNEPRFARPSQDAGGEGEQHHVKIGLHLYSDLFARLPVDRSSNLTTSTMANHLSHFVKVLINSYIQKSVR